MSEVLQKRTENQLNQNLEHTTRKKTLGEVGFEQSGHNSTWDKHVRMGMDVSF